MNSIDIDVEKFLKLISAKEKDWDEELLKSIAYGTIFLKYIEDNTTNTHYIKSFVQDALSIIDSLCHKSQRYYYFILRSYIENLLRVLLQLQDDDAMGVMKLFKNTKRFLGDFDEATIIFEQIEQQYNECSLFVHSNIKADEEISGFLKNIFVRNDFDEPLKVNTSLLKFESILNSSIKLFLISHSQTIDSCFYRKKDILRKILSEENYDLFSKSLA